MIDEIRIWRSARSASEISRDWHKRFYGDETGLVLVYCSDLSIIVCSRNTISDDVQYINGDSGSDIDATGNAVGDVNDILINGAQLKDDKDPFQ
jgi:hypothetical protein